MDLHSADTNASRSSSSWDPAVAAMTMTPGSMGGNHNEQHLLLDSLPLPLEFFQARHHHHLPPAPLNFHQLAQNTDAVVEADLQRNSHEGGYSGDGGGGREHNSGLEKCEEEEEEEEGEEKLGAMKEMMYKLAAMQPVDIDPATVRRPRRRNVRISDDPQSVSARHRRERISERMRILQRLVPGGVKMDTASMLDEAIRYVKFLKRQVHELQHQHPLPSPPPPHLAPPPSAWPTVRPDGARLSMPGPLSSSGVPDGLGLGFGFGNSGGSCGQLHLRD